LKDNILDKDKKDWENFISSDEKLSIKDIDFEQRKKPKIKSLDLHGYSLSEANKIVKDFIKKSYDQGFYKLLVITGKGLHSNHEKNPYLSKELSILKHSVPDFIKKNQDLSSKIIEMKQANIQDGGDGAFYIFLKRK